MWDVEFYVKPNGRCPVQEFMDDLNAGTERPFVVNAIEQLSEHGNRLDRPKAAHLRDQIYELRLKPDKRQIRILYFFDGVEIILLTHGFIKKGEQVPDFEIKKAIEYRAEYLKRRRGKTK